MGPGGREETETKKMLGGLGKQLKRFGQFSVTVTAVSSFQTRFHSVGSDRPSSVAMSSSMETGDSAPKAKVLVSAEVIIESNPACKMAVPMGSTLRTVEVTHWNVWEGSERADTVFVWQAADGRADGYAVGAAARASSERSWQA